MLNETRGHLEQGRTTLNRTAETSLIGNGHDANTTTPYYTHNTHLTKWHTRHILL